MREMIVNELTQATQELVREFARFLPRLMVMLIVVLVGWVIAYLVKAVLRSFLRLIKFDKLSEGAGATQLLNKAALPSSTELVSRFAFWTAWLGFILVGVSALGILGMQEYVTRFFRFPAAPAGLSDLPVHRLAGSELFLPRGPALGGQHRHALAPPAQLRGPGPDYSLHRVRRLRGTRSGGLHHAPGFCHRAWERSCWAWPSPLASAARTWPEGFLEARFAPEKKEGKEREDELSPL